MMHAIWLWACAEGGLTDELTVLSAAPTRNVTNALQVRFQTREAGTVTVQFGLAGVLDRSLDPVHLEPGVRSAVLVGLPPDAAVDVRVTLETERRVYEVDVTTATYPLPRSIPTWTVTVPESAAAEPGWIFTHLVDPEPVFLILDRDGTPLWVLPADQTKRLVPRVQPAQERADGVVFLHHDPVMATAESSVATQSWGGSPRGFVDVTWGHHDFLMDADGGVTYIAADFGLTLAWFKVAGDAVRTRHPDGTETELVSTWDWLDPLPNTTSPFYPGIDDWTHGNGLWRSDDGATTWLSLAHVHTILEVDANTGVSVLGEPGGWTYDPPESTMHHPHGPGRTADGHLLVLSTNKEVPTATSDVLEYELDRTGKVLREVWRHGSDLRAIVGGGPTRLPGGGTLVSYGSAGVLREVTPTNEVAWELRLDDRGTWGRASVLEPFDGFIEADE